VRPLQEIDRLIAGMGIDERNAYTLEAFREWFQREVLVSPGLDKEEV